MVREYEVDDCSESITSSTPYTETAYIKDYCISDEETNTSYSFECGSTYLGEQCVFINMYVNSNWSFVPNCGGQKEPLIVSYYDGECKNNIRYDISCNLSTTSAPATTTKPESASSSSTNSIIISMVIIIASLFVAAISYFIYRRKINKNNDAKSQAFVDLDSNRPHTVN